VRQGKGAARGRMKTSATGLNVYALMQPSQRLRERARAAGVDPNDRAAVMGLFWRELKAKEADPGGKP
jgi:hypothetical protein